MQDSLDGRWAGPAARPRAGGGDHARTPPGLGLRGVPGKQRKRLFPRRRVRGLRAAERRHPGLTRAAPRAVAWKPRRVRRASQPDSPRGAPRLASPPSPHLAALLVVEAHHHDVQHRAPRGALAFSLGLRLHERPRLGGGSEGGTGARASPLGRTPRRAAFGRPSVRPSVGDSAAGAEGPRRLPTPPPRGRPASSSRRLRLPGCQLTSERAARRGGARPGRAGPGRAGPRKGA